MRIQRWKKPAKGSCSTPDRDASESDLVDLGLTNREMFHSRCESSRE